MARDKIGPINGRVFGRLTVLETFIDGSYHVKCRCLCSCGRSTTVRRSQLLSDVCHSCGCLLRDCHLKHGHSAYHKETREYKAWKAMRERCGRAAHRSYARYGGRGIHVCERWSNFSLFLADMGNCPPGCSIDRIDNDGDYRPDNCRWATAVEQARHTRRTHYLEAFGCRKAMSAWAEELANATGKSTGMLRSRIYLGWSTETALHELHEFYEKPT